VVDAPDAPAPSPDEAPHSGTAFRITVLLGLLALVTAGGVAVGRALEPSSTAPTAVTTLTTTVARPAVVRPAIPKWGPVPARPFGKLTPGSAPAAAAIGGDRLVVVGGTSAGGVSAGPVGGRLVVVGKLPSPRAGVQLFAIGKRVYALGGATTPTAEILQIDPATGRVRSTGTFEEPLADAGVVSRVGSVLLVGGWTGSKYATAVLRFSPPSTVDLIARLPDGVRSPAVAVLGHTLYIAGGRTVKGPSRSVYAVDLPTGAVTVLGNLPRPVEGALLVSSGTKLYLLGGTSAAGKPSTAVVRIDPATGQPAGAGTMPRALAGAAAVADGAQTVVVDPRSGNVYRLG